MCMNEMHCVEENCFDRYLSQFICGKGQCFEQIWRILQSFIVICKPIWTHVDLSYAYLGIVK